MGVIYLIENSINGKVYVGSTRNIGTRINQHIARSKVNNELSMYEDMRQNLTAFTFSVLEVVDNSELLQKERDWIDKFGEERSLYNREPTSARGLSPDQVIEVKRMLCNTTFGIEAISRLTRAPLTTVYDINKGLVYKEKKGKYPLRVLARSQKFFTPEQVTKICLRLQTSESIKSICEAYGYKGEAVIRKINDGTYSIAPSQSFEYPIKPINSRKNKVQSSPSRN